MRNPTKAPLFEGEKREIRTKKSEKKQIDLKKMM